MKRFPLFVGLLLTAVVAQAQTQAGALEAGDPVRDNGARYDIHTFEAAEAQQVTVRMESDAFDTFLIVRSPSGIESVNDDYDGERVSLLDFIASEAGTWTVWASAYSEGLEGPYALTVTHGATGSIEKREGRLDHADEQALKGEFFDTHHFEISTGAEFLAELYSLGFDGYLVVTAPDGQTWRNDDAGSISLSRIGPLSGTGRWTVIVTSNQAGEVGAYDLRLITLPAGQ